MLAVSALLCLFGVSLLNRKLGDGLRLLSYDLPYWIGNKELGQGISVVFLDDNTFKELGQPLSESLDRRFHARLVDRLQEEGAQRIVFDIVFHESSPEADAEFAAAMERHGDVILAGELIQPEGEFLGDAQQLILATPDLRIAAAGWGLSEIPIDGDGVVRRVSDAVDTSFGEKPSLSAKAVGLEIDRISSKRRFLNYYGPRGFFENYSYLGVLENRGIPKGAFKDKIVFVGSKQKSGNFSAGKDTFPTPYSFFITKDRRDEEDEGKWGTKAKKAKRFSSGVEIQATATANLLRGDQFWVAPRWVNWLVVMGAGLGFAFLGVFLPAVRGNLLILVSGIIITVAGACSHFFGDYLWMWTVPAFGQLPLAIASSLGAHYVLEYSSRWKLQRAFKSYMSEEQARMIDEGTEILELGGKEVEATVFFSDLEGFTAMSEGLPPEAVSKALISYFELATAGILEQQGTIIKYIGDAVMATWGAPLRVERESDRSIEAAIQMQVAGRTLVSLETQNGKVERVLHTRIGINRGLGLAGNLGSQRRFDYSVIGDTTNLAARLEGLNKMLGTSVLVTQSVMDDCEEPERFRIRRMGRFVVKGRKSEVVVYEVLGNEKETVRERGDDYLTAYASGLEAFENGSLTEARSFFEKSLDLYDKDEKDPASELFLAAIADRDETIGSSWKGAIVLASK